MRQMTKYFFKWQNQNPHSKINTKFYFYTLSEWDRLNDLRVVNPSFSHFTSFLTLENLNPYILY